MKNLKSKINTGGLIFNLIVLGILQKIIFDWILTTTASTRMPIYLQSESIRLVVFALVPALLLWAFINLWGYKIGLIRRVGFFVFYQVFIDKVYGSLRNTRMFLRLRDVYEPIYESFPKRWLQTINIDEWEKVQSIGATGKPVLVLAEHLQEKAFWDNWAFAAVLLRDEIVVKKKKVGHRDRYTLTVDLTHARYGIYNNVGKLFLNHKYLENSEFQLSAQNVVKCMDQFWHDKTEEVRIPTQNMPFRWSSGGILPIAQDQSGKNWFVLFFRDIKPCGWNIANGSSEIMTAKSNELMDLYGLMYREFAEEVVCLSRSPLQSDGKLVDFSLSQHQFTLQVPIDSGYKVIMNPEFTKRHNLLRQMHDGLTIKAGDPKKLKTIPTLSDVYVTRNGKTESQIHDVIFSINPTEFGIEILLVAHFDINLTDAPENCDTLLDGEIWEVGKGAKSKALIRQPMILLSCNFVYELFNENKTLGNIESHGPYINCKRILKNIPKDEYRIFYEEVELRKMRWEHLKNDINTRTSPEAQRYEDWLYGDKGFYQKLSNLNGHDIDFSNPDNELFSMLCPVTWKSIENVCRFKLLDRLS